MFQYTDRMKLIAQLKLQPTPAQADALRRTLEAANAACTAMSDTAWQTQTFRQFELQKLVYEHTRATFGLAAQLTVRCISKVADAYTLDRKAQRTFRPHGSDCLRRPHPVVEHARAVRVDLDAGRPAVDPVCDRRAAAGAARHPQR